MNTANPHGVFTSALTDIAAILQKAVADDDLEAADMTSGQLLEFAEAFRETSNYARRLERYLSSLAKH